MNLSFFDFFANVIHSPALITTVILTLGVIFVNGWTDAPNAITSCVCSNTLSLKKAVFLAAVCNFLGTVLMTYINSSVAYNIFSCADFSGSDNGRTALSCALVSVIILAVGAWIMGIPTSESHAIICSLIGSAVACGAKIHTRVIIFTFFGLILSVSGGFIAGYFIYRSMRYKNYSQKRLRHLQILGATLMSFMHGAQDGQKFISIFLVAISLSVKGAGFDIPVWAALLCSSAMALGTALGGKRIIFNIGRKMTNLDLKQGVSADIAGSISLFMSTCLGMPVSTTHAKTSAIMGCGYADSSLDWHTARKLLYAWVITFPACFIMGYIFTAISI